jgi:inorganic pyrophosphatase
LEPEKWVRVGRWGGAEEARRVLVEAIDRAKAKGGS